MTDGPPDATADTAVRGLVLAGGESTRFEAGDKAVASVGDRSIVGHVLGELRESLGTTPVVVVRDDDQRRAIENRLADDGDPLPAVATDDPDFRGPVAGLLGGAATADTAWAFAAGCDMPLLDREAVSWLVDRATESNENAVVPRTAGGLEPLHSVYRCDALEDAREGLAPSASLHALLDTLADVEYVDPEDCPVDLAQSLTNVNTVEDLAAVGTERDRSTDGSADGSPSG